MGGYSDALSPESAAAAGVELKRLLWLRTAGERQQAKEQVLSRLEQAIKATGLLLKTGAFAAIVLDMSDVHSRQTMRIPLSMWYSFRLAAEQARTALVLLTQSPCANNCAALVLHCEPASITPLSAAGETALFDGQQHIVTRERNRNEGASFAQKKPSGHHMADRNYMVEGALMYAVLHTRITDDPSLQKTLSTGHSARWSIFRTET